MDTYDALFEMVKSQLHNFGSVIEKHDKILTRLPRDLRDVIREHRDTCEAYRHFDDLDQRTNDVTGIVKVQEERLRAAQEKLAKNSRYPKGKSPWWAPSFSKLVALLCALAGTAGGIGFCSSDKPPKADTDRGSKLPVASINP
jgi:hypothetical protein